MKRFLRIKAVRVLTVLFAIFLASCGSSGGGGSDSSGDNSSNCDQWGGACGQCIIDTDTQIATINVDGNPSDWASLTPAIVDPQGDSICGTNADIKHIYTAIDNDYAYVMVETYASIHNSAIVEIDFNYKPGQHFSNLCEPDLTTNILTSTLLAWTDVNLDDNLESYPISGYIVVRDTVMEAKIPLSEIENATYFNATFVNIWDSAYPLGNDGCDPTYIGWIPD